MGKITINMDSLKTGRDWVRHKVNDGSNIFRILPPFGDAETHRNYPYHRWSIAWLQDPKSGKRRPFASPLTKGEACPIQEYSDALNKYIEEKKAVLSTSGLTDVEVKEELEGLRTVQWNMRLQHLYAYNACDQSGSVGLLEIKTTAHKAMKKMMNQYIKDYAQDPTSLSSDEDDSGVWFNISKEGKGKDTEYSVSFNQTREKDDKGRIIKVDDRSALPENVVVNYENLAYNLHSIYQSKSYDEMYEMLLFNLSILAEEVPDVSLGGLYPVEGAVTKVVAKEPTVRAAPAAVPAAKKVSKVALKLDDEDDEEPPFTKTPVRAAPVAAKRTVPVQSFDDDELSALTAEILGD